MPIDSDRGEWALLTTAEASRMLRLPARRIREAAASGRLRAVRVGAWLRFRRTDLLDWTRPLEAPRGGGGLRESLVAIRAQLAGELARRAAMDLPDAPKLAGARDAIEIALVALDCDDAG